MVEEQRLDPETSDHNAIRDVAEIEESPMEEMDSTVLTVSSLWNLKETKKGIIWCEVMEAPISKTRRHLNRSL